MTKSDDPRLTVDVWSDVMCPFCYMGDTLLARALEQFPHKEHVDLRYRSYQLMPGLPEDSCVNATEILVRAKGIPRAQAVAMNKQVEARAAELGLEYHLDGRSTTPGTRRSRSRVSAKGRPARLLGGVLLPARARHGP